jgi:hypothetical protein
MIGLVTLDDVLRLLFGSVSLITLEDDLGGHFLLDRPADASGFRVPFDMIAALKFGGHWAYLLIPEKDEMIHFRQSPIPYSIDCSLSVSHNSSSSASGKVSTL